MKFRKGLPANFIAKIQKQEVKVHLRDASNKIQLQTTSKNGKPNPENARLSGRKSAVNFSCIPSIFIPDPCTKKKRKPEIGLRILEE
ncbi:hypothetical protein I5M27_12375 [Adhaeribacter sp. BT258]|uniref:Uncharacterized protein n=1 Tax=Adhaeribacter terrigena TaxID=2793070 RepID=A0ABS1C555_9BACT|nr:hypothetical protein [Adhaeribacter terrigena]MBK0403788.1 hypothetical protein [Adhaeribacter terrigena]